MGSFSVYCDISKITITEGDDCVLLVLRDNPRDVGKFKMTMLPIYGYYNDYGSIIPEGDNEKAEEMIRKYFNVDLGEFLQNLYNTKDSRIPFKEEYEGLYYTFIHRDVWDYLSSKGEVKDEDFKFWALRSITGEDYYNVNIYKLENMTIEALNKLLSIGSKQYLLDNSKSSFERGDNRMGEYYKKRAKNTNDNARILMYDAFHKEEYKEEFLKMYKFYMNIHCAAYSLSPYLYLDNYPPQCGDFENHQELLNKFAEINHNKLKTRKLDRFIWNYTHRKLFRKTNKK